MSPLEGDAMPRPKAAQLARGARRSPTMIASAPFLALFASLALLAFAVTRGWFTP